MAIAVAAAGLRTRLDVGIESIAVAAADGDRTARESAEALAAGLGAKLIDLAPPAPPPSVDLIVVGSQPNAVSRRITLSGVDSHRAELRARLGAGAALGHRDPLF